MILRRSEMRSDARDSTLRILLTILLLLLVLDLGYVLAHVAFNLGLSQDVAFRLDRDRGRGEFYGYHKLVWSALLTCVWAVRARSAWVLAWAGFFCFLLLDDYQRLHETGGTWLVQRGVNAGLIEQAAGESLSSIRFGPFRVQDYAELLVLGVTGFSWIGLILLGCWLGNRPLRRATWQFLPPMALLICFGTGIDFLHSFSGVGKGWLKETLAIVEDGGELVALSFLLTIAAAGALGMYPPLKSFSPRPDAGGDGPATSGALLVS